MPSRPRHQGRSLKQPTRHVTHRARHPTKQSTSLHHPRSQPSNHSHQPPHTYPCLVHPTMCVPHTTHTNHNPHHPQHITRQLQSVPDNFRVCNCCSNFATCGPNAFAPSAPSPFPETTHTPHHPLCSSPNQPINITTPSTFISIKPLPSTAPHTSMSRAPNHVCATHHTRQPQLISPSTHHASAANTYFLNSEFATAATLPHVGPMLSRPRHQGRSLKQPTHHITHHARHPTKQSTSRLHPPSQPSNHSHQPPHTHIHALCTQPCVCHTPPTATHITPNTSRVSCEHVLSKFRVCNCSNCATCGPNAFAPSAPSPFPETTNTPHHPPCSSPNQTINSTTPSTFTTIQPLPSTAPHTSMSRASNDVCAIHHTH